MAEFTGERVIPGLVDEDLLNEHLARYRFAARIAGFMKAAAVLDTGCGAGYGSAEFGDGVSVTATDISADAMGHARENYGRAGVRFLQAGCERLPFAEGSFDLVTAFEVIEHLEHWQELLTEARRVLKPGGVLLVSTPNKSYYAESRAAAGPNPFHCHEFEYAEFDAALHGVFPHVRMWTQNHAEVVVFAPLSPAGACLHAEGDATPERAHFFVAACSLSEIGFRDVYAWMPSTANLLREREHHIAKLKGELLKKDQWLNEVKESHAGLQRSHEATLAELKQRNEWAARLNRELEEKATLITQLQVEAVESLKWARSLEAEIARGNAEIERLMGWAGELESDLTARTEWARGMESELHLRTRHMQAQAVEIEEQTAELQRQAAVMGEQSRQLARLTEQQRLIAGSKWIRLGRKLNLGPMVQAE